MARVAGNLDSTGNRIGLKRHLHPEVVAGEAAYLFSEHGVTALRSALSEVLVPLLDGSRTLAELIEELPNDISPDDCRAVIAQLRKAGLVTDRPPVASRCADETLAFWDAAGLDAATAAEQAAASRIRLIRTPGVADSVGTQFVESAGLEVTTDGDADLSVVLCTDYLDARLATIDAEHRRDQRPWLLAKVDAPQVWIGPVFRPEPGCWHCLASRLRLHRHAEFHVQSALGRTGPVERTTATLPALRNAGLQLVAAEAQKWLAGYRYPGQDSVWIVDGLTMRGQHHRVSPRPQCEACGRPELTRAKARTPVRLRQRTKTSVHGGGHRARGSDEVWDTYQHLISPVTGIVKEIRRDHRGPAFAHCYRSGPNAAAAPRGLDGLRAVMRAENGGKGRTARDAEVGALCEAVERYSASFHGDEERVRGTFRSWGEQAIHPNDCLLFHERQYAERDGWNRAHAPFQHVFEPFDPNAVLDWTPVWSLTGQDQRLLPTSMLYFGTPTRRHFAHADSNGNAAGGTLEDAVLQGVLELIERDAVALWWYNRTRQPGLDLSAFKDPWIDELRDGYARLGREIWALDLTSDLGIPVVAALSRERGPDGRGVVFGFGAHLDPQVALGRALAELNQMTPIAMNAELDGTDPDATRWFRHATVRNQPYLLPDPRHRAHGPGDFAYQPREDLRDDVSALDALLGKHGMRTFVLDQTRPDIELPVVKVIVPGLRHFWARFGHGRLYDVPVRLGHRSRPTPYAELNPLPLFI